MFVAGFFFPVVPKGQARIRTQMSAALTEADIDFAIAAFAEAGKALGIVWENSQRVRMSALKDEGTCGQ